MRAIRYASLFILDYIGCHVHKRKEKEARKNDREETERYNSCSGIEGGMNHRKISTRSDRTLL